MSNSSSEPCSHHHDEPELGRFTVRHEDEGRDDEADQATLDRRPLEQRRLDAMIDIEFDGYLTMETGFHRRGIEPDQDAREGIEYLRPLVERKLAERKIR